MVGNILSIDNKLYFLHKTVLNYAKIQLKLCPYPWILELREPTKLVLLTLHLYAFTQGALC